MKKVWIVLYCVFAALSVASIAFLPVYNLYAAGAFAFFYLVCIWIARTQAKCTSCGRVFDPLMYAIARVKKRKHYCCHCGTLLENP